MTREEVDIDECRKTGLPEPRSVDFCVDKCKLKHLNYHFSSYLKCDNDQVIIMVLYSKP